MTTLRDRELQTPAPPQRRGPWLVGALLLFAALVAAGIWLLLGNNSEPAPAPAEPALSPAERNAQLQAADVAAATETIETYHQYLDRIFTAWDIDAAPITDVATPAYRDGLKSLLDTAAIDDPTYTGTVTVEVGSEPVTWTPATPRTMTLQACADVSQSSLTDGGAGPDVRFLPGGAELIPRYVVDYDLVQRSGSWLVSSAPPTSEPC